ncbi:hypothetical protein Hanom_Chr07g00605691 [Helianthus anomalus]
MKPVLRENNEGKLRPDEEGWYDTIVGNFWVSDEATLNALLPRSKDPAATGVSSAPVTMVVDKYRCKRKTHAPVIIPPLVPDASGTYRPRFRKYEDYVVVSDTLEGSSVPGNSSRAGGAATGTKPVDDKKRKGDALAAGGEKAPKLRECRKIVISKHKHGVLLVKTMKEPISASSMRSSPPKALDAEGQTKAAEDPVI